MANNTITAFEDLRVWQESQNLAVVIYAITKQFPKDEMFAITSQLRRAASYVSANIAEGFGRKTVNDKSHFYVMSYGSLLETKNFLYLANRLDYFDNQVLENLIAQITSCQKLLNALKRGLQNDQ